MATSMRKDNAAARAAAARRRQRVIETTIRSPLTTSNTPKETIEYNTNNKQDSSMDDELNITIEEEVDPREDSTIDASCLYSSNLLRIRAHNLCYLHKDDSFLKLKADSDGATALHIICNDSNETLYYNQTIQFKAKQLYLGARAYEENDKIIFRIGLFPELHHWTLLRGSPGLRVRVGSTVQQQTLVNQILLRSGDPIVLRHVATGGILTVQDDATLQLATDGYDRGGETSNLHHLIVTPDDIFHLHLATVPPVPLWLNSRLNKRIYQDTSYLQQPERKANNVVSKRNFLDYTGIMRESRKQQLRTVQGQERVLLDELFGAFMGLEGREFIVIRSNECPMAEIAFTVIDTVPLEKTLHRIVTEMLPLANAYVRVNHFATRMGAYEFGTVMQSFCQALDGLLQEYVVFIANLEQQCRTGTNQDMLLRRLQVQVQSSLHIMSVLERATRTVVDKKGGALLNALRRLKLWTYEGDEAASKTLNFLLEHASKPYLEMLTNWVERGMLNDPFREFMVSYDESRDWEDRYTVVKENILEGFFSTSLTIDRVVAAGKYWNAVIRCNEGKKDQKQSDEGMQVEGLAEPISYNTNMTKMSTFVQSMYYRASQSLERLLIEEYDLIGALRVMRKYFLLDQGDFFVHFLDAAETELVRELADVSYGRVQHFLTTSIQMTENIDEDAMLSNRRNNTRYKLTPSDLRCRFVPESLLEQLDKIHAATGGIDTHDFTSPQRHVYGGISDEGLKGLDSFMLDLPSIPFPLSLVLSSRSLSGYQLLFRHIFLAKHVERRLVGIWQDHQAIKELQEIRGSLGKTFLLRQRMLHFMQNLIYYTMFEILEPNWSKLEEDIREASSSLEGTVDDILSIHSEFLERTREACLLTNRNLVRALTKVMMTCLMFSDQMRRFMEATKIEEEQRQVANEKQNEVQRSLNNRGLAKASVSMEKLREKLKKERAERKDRISRHTARVEREISNESYQRMIERFDEVFSDHLRSFMIQLTRSDELYHNHKVNLCIQLDYNGFVAQDLDLSRASGSRY